MSLNFVDKFFDGVNALEVMYDDHEFESTVNRMTKKERFMIENALRGMSKLQKINHLTLLYDHNSIQKDNQMAVGAIKSVMREMKFVIKFWLLQSY